MAQHSCLCSFYLDAVVAARLANSATAVVVYVEPGPRHGILGPGRRVSGARATVLTWSTRTLATPADTLAAGLRGSCASHSQVLKHAGLLADSAANQNRTLMGRNHEPDDHRAGAVLGDRAGPAR